MKREKAVWKTLEILPVLLLSLLMTPNIYGQEPKYNETLESESKTSTDCVNSLFNRSIDSFQPSTIQTITRNESMSTINPSDLDRLGYLIKFCDFYHEKTGQWIDANTILDVGMAAEFTTKNFILIPKSTAPY